jgi:Ca2+-binding EF-hand superfamily protein
LSIFNVRAKEEIRIRFLFDIFDINNERVLSKEVLREIHFIMTKNEIDDENEIEKILEQYDSGKKGFLDYNDFVVFYREDPSLEKNLVIKFQKKSTSNRIKGLWELIWPKRVLKKD